MILTEVNEEEVKVLETPILELLLADGHDILLGVEGVPQLENRWQTVNFK